MRSQFSGGIVCVGRRVRVCHSGMELLADVLWHPVTGASCQAGSAGLHWLPTFSTAHGTPGQLG